MLILALALPAGALMFLVITLVAVKPPAPPLNFDIDTFVLVFFGQVVVVAPLAYIVPGLILKNTGKQAFAGINLQAEIERESRSDEPPKQIDRFLNIYTTQLIVGLALLEGMALFGIMIYILNQSMICLIGAGILILLMLTKFPTLSRVQTSLANYARDQQIEGERKI